METIRELLARLTTLTPEELADLRAQIVAESERLDVDTASAEDIAALLELAEFGDQVVAEAANREAVAAQQQTDRAAARERIAALRPSENAESGEQAEGEQEQTEQTEEPAAETEQAQAPEPVAATGAVARMAARQGTPRPSPEAASTSPRNRATLIATGALRGLRDPNQPIESREQFAEAMAQTLQRMPRNGAPRGDVLLASATWEYPEDRRLSEHDAWGNDSRIDAVAGLQALTATGGICAPTNIDYSVPTWAVADRPLRDGLPAFQATRGGILFIQPPDIGTLAGATGIWTEATDAAPGALTKPIVSIQCGSQVQVFVDAITFRLGFGNMLSRFAPEQVAANTDLAVAAGARVAENNLLNKIAAVCVQNVTAPVATTGLGAVRDLITTLHQALAAYRNAHRIPDSQTITAVFPEWLKALLKTDLAREIGHQQDSSWNALMISDQQIEDLLAATGIHPIWHLDGQPSSVSGGVAQVFGIQGGGANILTFPTKVVFYLFPEGQIQFLDGGRLDLGVVRDSTLDATNDYEIFQETFESIAFRGFASGAIQYVTSLVATGASSGTVSVTSAA